VEPGAHFEQGADPALHLNPARSRGGNSRDEFQDGTFAGPVFADEPNDFALANLKRNAIQGSKPLAAPARLPLEQPFLQRRILAFPQPEFFTA
jgi:hypothetical protein